MKPGIAEGEVEQPLSAKQGGEAVVVRAATLGDADAVAGILAEAFPSLYRSTFGRLDSRTIPRLLAALYQAGTLSLEATQVATDSERVVGLVILHVGKSIGRGSAANYWTVLGHQLPWWRRQHAFFGGLSVNAVLSRRIPQGPDLVYIEALAVAAGERGHGIGTLLLQEAADWAIRSDRYRLALHVLETNRGARRLYERVGFRQWHAPRPARRALLSLFSVRPPAWSALLMLRKLNPVAQK